MNLPTIEKTWQFNVNQTASGATTEESIDNCLLTIKNSLINFASSPWTVWGSSNSSSYNSGGGTDYWSDHDDLVHNYESSAHSWIVLNSPNGSQICFTCNNSTDYITDIIFSPQGLFTEGSTTNTPTASDQFSEEFILSNSNTTYRVHILHSTDGYCTRIVNYYSNTLRNFVLCDVAKNPSTELTLPVWINVDGNTTYSSMNSTNDVKSIISGNEVKFYCTSEMFGADMIGETLVYPDDDIGYWYMFPMGLYTDTAPHRGKKGFLYDIWWGSTALASGTTYPGNGTKQFAQFGDIILPWNGTEPQLS